MSLPPKLTKILDHNTSMFSNQFFLTNMTSKRNFDESGNELHSTSTCQKDLFQKWFLEAQFTFPCLHQDLLKDQGLNSRKPIVLLKSIWNVDFIYTIYFACKSFSTIKIMIYLASIFLCKRTWFQNSGWFSQFQTLSYNKIHLK